MKKLMNNKSGFTLMEVMVAMALVTIVATFTAMALTANGKSLTKTQEISKGSGSSLSECENYLANDAEHGKTEGDLKLKKTSGGLTGFPDITLEIKDSSETNASANETNVKYVAFKRVGENNSAVGGGGVSSDGSGITSGSDGGGDKDSGVDKEPEKHPVTEAPTLAPVTETPTETPTLAPVTEAPTQAATSAPATEAQTEAPTNSTPQQGAGSVYFNKTSLKDKTQPLGWRDGYVLSGVSMKNTDDVEMNVGYSVVSDVTTEGVLLKGSDSFVVDCVHDSSWRGKYYVTVYLTSESGGNPDCYVNNVHVTEKVYRIPYDENSNGRFEVRVQGGSQVIVTGVNAEKFGDKW